jgi:hypothetical protein
MADIEFWSAEVCSASRRFRPLLVMARRSRPDPFVGLQDCAEIRKYAREQAQHAFHRNRRFRMIDADTQDQLDQVARLMSYRSLTVVKFKSGRCRPMVFLPIIQAPIVQVEINALAWEKATAWVEAL